MYVWKQISTACTIHLSNANRMPFSTYHPEIFNGVNGGSGLWSKIGKKFEVINDVVINSAIPAFGSVNGGSRLFIEGLFPLAIKQYPANKAFCSFDTAKVPATILNLTSIFCLSPPILDSETVQLRISIDDGQSFSDSFVWFNYHQMSRVTRLNPNHGGFRGGYFILVKGSYFIQSQKLKYRFGNIQSSQSMYISSTQILCLSPRQSNKMSVPVEVTSNGKDYSFSRTTFHYHESLVIDNVWPITFSISIAY